MHHLDFPLFFLSPPFALLFLFESRPNAAAPRPPLAKRIALRTLSTPPSPLDGTSRLDFFPDATELSRRERIANDVFFSSLADCSFGANYVEEWGFSMTRYQYVYEQLHTFRFNPRTFGSPSNFLSNLKAPTCKNLGVAKTSRSFTHLPMLAVLFFVVSRVFSTADLRSVRSARAIFAFC